MQYSHYIKIAHVIIHHTNSEQNKLFSHECDIFPQATLKYSQISRTPSGVIYKYSANALILNEKCTSRSKMQSTAVNFLVQRGIVKFWLKSRFRNAHISFAIYDRIIFSDCVNILNLVKTTIYPGILRARTYLRISRFEVTFPYS